MNLLLSIHPYYCADFTLDLIGAKLLSLSQKVENISKEDLVKVLDKEIGKTPKKESQDTPHVEESTHEQIPFGLWLHCFAKMPPSLKEETIPASMP